MGLDTKTYCLTDRQSQCDFDFDSLGRFTVKRRQSRSQKSEVKSVIYVVWLQKPLECYHCSELRSVIVTVRLKVLQLIVIPPGEYPINRVSNPKSSKYCRVT
jgi:hypothetical protein